MGSSAPHPTLLKVWISWVKGGLLLRILGIPAVLLALHLEVYGSSPHASSQILHRLSRRLRLSQLACRLVKQNSKKQHRHKQHHHGRKHRERTPETRPRGDEHANSSAVLKPSVMATAQSRAAPKTPNLLSRERSVTPDSKDRPAPASPISPSPELQPPSLLPSPVQHHHHHHLAEAADAPSPVPSCAPSLLPPTTPSPHPRSRPAEPSPPAAAAPPAPAPAPAPAPVPVPSRQPPPVRHVEPPAPQSFVSRSAHTNAASQPVTAVKLIQAALASRSRRSAASPVEPSHPPLPNTSAARVSLTPRPDPLPTPAPTPVDHHIDEPSAPPPAAAALPAPRPQSALPSTLLELETFKALLRSSSPLTPSPSPRLPPLGRSKSNAAASRASWAPRTQPHPDDTEAFERFKALLRGTSEPSSALPSPKFRPQPSPLQVPESTEVQSSASSPLARTTPSTPMPSTRSSHARSMSHASGVPRSNSKRLSLQFPIQPSPSFTPKLRPQSWVAAPSPMSPSASESSQTETNLLAVLAAQERYVLELKEELIKAEEDLKMLKNIWTSNEIAKQRNDSRRLTQLQPLNTSLANLRAEPGDEDATRLQEDKERKKALLSAKLPNKNKVFIGSRHLRTLSLLSPDTLTANYSPSFPQPLDIRDGIDESSARPHTLIRHATTPDLSKHNPEPANDDQFDIGSLTNVQRDAILRTGKKMATDLKDGFINFIEDIRQATVGDDPTDNVPASAKSLANKNARKASASRAPLNKAAGSKKSTSQKTDAIADDFWKEHGLNESKAAPANRKTQAIKNTATPQKASKDLEELEDWDNWDTPNDKYSATANNSSDESVEPSSPSSGLASSRTSTRYHSKRHDSKASSLTSISSSGPAEDAVLRENTKRNSIQWPDLVKLSPGNLKRTASHLMKEWEKTLTPPPESRVSDHSSGDYVGRSTTPPNLL